jgi:alkanesulfonate monooxygenase SsuD/methylene tetrahydromethanopterin reductase-like flavin-dependent oxidoreductase (luciferase family)
MKIFAFDLLPYAEHLDHLKEGKELPWPLPKRHFRPEVAARTYEEHLEAWALMDEIGFDGVGFNEHHTSPYGLMTSPNIMAAAAAQRTRRLKLLIYGNLLPIHNPLRLAEELAMLDCISGGRIISGFARGIPREYVAYNVSLEESRARFEEAWEIIKRAWTEEVLTYHGTFWSFQDVAIWPRPLQQPHPPVWVPVTGSKETLQWAGRENVPITPGLGGPLGFRLDVVRFYAECLAQHGHQITPDHLVLPMSPYVADNREQAIKEAGPYTLYFNQTLFSHGNITEAQLQQQRGYLSANPHDYVRPEHRAALSGERSRYRDMTLADLERNQALPWGRPEEVRDRLIAEAEGVGANTLLLNFNRGAMPHAMFMEQLRRFGAEVLPALQAHPVTKVPV